MRFYLLSIYLINEEIWFKLFVIPFTWVKIIRLEVNFAVIRVAIISFGPLIAITIIKVKWQARSKVRALLIIE